MVFKTTISFTCGLYRFYPVLPMGKTDCFTEFYPILPNWFYPLGKTTMPTLPAASYKPTTLAKRHQLSDYTHGRYYSVRKKQSCSCHWPDKKTLILFPRGHSGRDHDRDQIVA